MHGWWRPDRVNHSWLWLADLLGPGVPFPPIYQGSLGSWLTHPFPVVTAGDNRSDWAGGVGGVLSGVGVCREEEARSSNIKILDTEAEGRG